MDSDIEEQAVYPSNKKKGFKCEACNSGFATKQTLSRHIKNNCSGSVKGKPVCEICQKSFKKPSLLKRHQRSKKCATAVIVSTTCELSPQNLEEKNNQDVVYELDCGDASFNKEDYSTTECTPIDELCLNEHIKHEGELMEERMLRKQNERVAKFQCQFCEQKFSDKARFDTHMNEPGCLFQIPYYVEFGQRRCGFCQEPLSSLEVLENHGMEHQRVVVHPVGMRVFETQMEAQTREFYHFSIPKYPID